MITKIHYKNFKALRDTTLPLGRFTLIVGANGTGKTTALKALQLINFFDVSNLPNYLSKEAEENEIQIEVIWNNFSVRKTVSQDSSINHYLDEKQRIVNGSGGNFTSFIAAHKNEKESKAIENFKLFAFESEELIEASVLKPNIELRPNGTNLGGVLWQIQSSEPEVFEQLNNELHGWFPDFDRIVFEVPDDGKISFLLRTSLGKHKIKARDISDGTRLALAYLTVAYLPNPPRLVAFEEPEKGIHPRLLRNIQEAMYRLAYPENYGEKREPVQVIATTHSPYLLDLYKDYPEEIVIASKDENGVHFERLIDQPHYEEVIQDAPLGEVWYTGVLGGVPVQP